MLLYNFLSLKAMVFAMAPMLIFQNGKMCFDILTFEKEPFHKSTFVRLIGQHDSTYLMVMFTLLVSVMSIMDACATETVHLVNLIYIPFVMYQVVKIMDTKQARLANSFFPIIATVFTILAIYIYMAAYVVASKDQVVEKPTFPLYVYKPEVEAVEQVAIGPEEEADPLTWSQAIYARCSLGGFWFFLDWVIYPFWNWIVMTWWNWTVAPILDILMTSTSWIFSSISYYSGLSSLMTVMMSPFQSPEDPVLGTHQEFVEQIDPVSAEL